MSVGGEIGLAFKSCRDDLFIEPARPHDFSFCFSAARVQISRRTIERWPAPLKNKIISGDYQP